MRRGTNIKLVGLTVFFIALHLSSASATGADRWRERFLAICNDADLSDSLKVVKASEVTYNYSNYYRTIGEEELDEFLKTTLPIAERLHAGNVRILVYSTALFMAATPERIADVSLNCLYYTENERTGN